MLTKLYRKYVSPETREKIYSAFLSRVLVFFRFFDDSIKASFIYLFQWLLPKTEENKLFAFMGKHGLTHLPYPFVLEYKNKVIDCQFDEKRKLFFVNHCGEKLYFPRSHKKEDVVYKYRTLLAEQDPRSPHQYLKNTNRLKAKTLLDVGAAEAMFSLDTIELTQKVYLFECDKEWIEALEATFEKWQDKVEIVQKYVSDINDDQNITIDNFLEKRDKANLFIKMDIEGYEQAALRGAANTLKEAADIDFSICTYHKENDAKEIAQLLQQYNFKYEQTEGYFYFKMPGNKGFRRAIIRRAN